MKNNISVTDLEESIDYFKEINIKEGEIFYFFLLLKAMGFNENVSNNFSLSKLSDEEREMLKDTLYLLGSTFNEKLEICEKYGLSFPSGIKEYHNGSTNKQDIFYQPGSKVTNLSRAHDTIKNFRGIKFYDYDESDNSVKFKSDYIEIIVRDYLLHEKISMKHIISWAFKFIEFETSNSISPMQFTSMLKAHFIKTFKLTKRELSKIFVDDLYITPLTNRTISNTGEHFRAYSGLETYIQSLDDVDYNDLYVAKTESKSTYDFTFSTKHSNDIALEQSGENLSPYEVEGILRNKKQIILTGVPGTGKSFYTQVIEGSSFFNGMKSVVQFHPNYTYEDFIGGETLTVSDGATTTESEKGVFLDFIEEAKLNHNKDKNHLFIIDEINRGNIANIFGETILMLDREYSVNLARPIAGCNKIQIPENVYIIGTMNTSDRNIAFLDLAIRRRFAFVPLKPNYEFLTENVKIEQENFNLGAILKYINDKVTDITKEDSFSLGQSYFIPANKNYVWSKKNFQIQFNHVLIPTLEEYSYNHPNILYSIIGDLSDQIPDTNLFYERFQSKFEMFKL